MSQSVEMRSYRDHIHEFIKSGSSVVSSFACGGPISLRSIPAVEVEGVGRLGFPLCKQQAVDLVKIAEQAPFGKGKFAICNEITIIDFFLPFLQAQNSLRT